MKFLFDLGGVFFDWDPKHFYKDIFSSNDDMEYFLTNICNNEWNLQQDAGKKIEDAEFELIQQFPKYKKEIFMYYKNHRKMIKNIFQSSIDALKELKSKNYKCYVLSNWSSETFIGMCDEYKFLNDFDGMIISGDYNLVKPDEKIFKLAIEKFDLTPQDTVFIDDRIENIEASELLNFKTIHLINPNKIREKINQFIKS